MMADQMTVRETRIVVAYAARAFGCDWMSDLFHKLGANRVTDLNATERAAACCMIKARIDREGSIDQTVVEAAIRAVDAFEKGHQ